MQLSHTFSGLALFILATTGIGMSTLLAVRSEDQPSSVDTDKPAAYLVSSKEMMHWIANTDAELSFVGKPINPLAQRSAGDTMVTYCNTRIGSICGGSCTVYNGGATCINTPDTACLAATNDVGFCDRGGCGHSCHELSDCGTHLENNFCFTPGTQSILVSVA